MKNKMPLSGIIPPLITPLNDDLTLDKASLGKLLEHILEAGVHGVFILGTTGESASLSSKVKNELITEVSLKINSRVPLLVGITDCSFAESIALAHKSANAGASYLVAAPPFYMNIGQDELRIYYEKLADSIPLPLFLYNMPSHTGISIAPQTVYSLSQHPNIIGIKDSSGDLECFDQICQITNYDVTFSVLVGPEEYLSETMALGGHGGVCGGANLFPELYVNLYNAISTGDIEKEQKLKDCVTFLSDKIYSHGNYQSNYLKGLKAAMQLAGLCKGVLAPPLYAFTEEEKSGFSEKYTAVVDKLKLNL